MFSSHKLQLLALNSGLNAEQLSAKTNINISTIVRLLNGTTTNPQPETVNSLAKYFGVSPAEFYEFNQDGKVLSANSSKPRDIKEVLEYLLIKTGILNTSMLHKLSGIPKSNLDRILSGNTVKPNIATLKQLAQFFNLSIAQISGLANIDETLTTTLPKQLSRLPPIKINAVPRWYNNTLEANISYINTTRLFIENKAFAILVENNKLKPDFEQGNILVLDSTITPDYSDFILVMDDNDIFVCEFHGVQNGQLSYRPAGSRQIKQQNLAIIRIYGVVVQEIINRKPDIR